MSLDNYFKKPFDTQINNTVSSDSDSDEYVDLSNLVEEDIEHIFQFHLNFDKLFLKYIGKSSQAPDIIIKENFGPESNMFLYNCVYSHYELEMYNKDVSNDTENNFSIDSDLFLPIIKLIVKEEIKESNSTNQNSSPNSNQNQDYKITISSFAIKLGEKVKYDDEFTDWELYWVENVNTNDYVRTIKIDKNINPTNIIEKLIEMSLKYKKN